METYTETRGMFLFAGVPAERLPETRPDVIDLSGANLRGANLRLLPCAITQILGSHR